MTRLSDFVDALRRRDSEELVFDRRYSSGAVRKDRSKASIAAWIEGNSSAIARIGKPRPESMSWFDSLFTTEAVADSLAKDKRKVVGMFCNLVPEELIIATGARPVRLCSGSIHNIKHSESVFPRDCCDLIRSSLGNAMVSDPLAGSCDLVVLPATCDGKKKLGEILDEIVPVFMLDLPQSRERAQAKEYWLKENYLLKDRLVRLTGRRVGRKELKEAIRITNERNSLLRSLQEMRCACRISGRDSLLVIQASFMADTDDWMHHTKRLLDELARRKNSFKNMARILVSGSPMIFPSTKLADVIESHGGMIVADMTCSGAEYGRDEVVPDDWSMSDMMKAISERYLMPSMCPCFMKSEDRIDRALDMVKECGIQGVVYYVLRHCLLFDAEAIKLKKALEKRGIPFLQVMSDYSPEDREQLRTRVEAFIEMIQAKG